MNHHHVSRRAFLKTASAASVIGFPMIVPRHVLGGPDAPSNKLNIAGIGCGDQSRRVLLRTGENVVAACDVDTRYAGRVFQSLPNARTYTDYRVMLEKEKDIDAVVVCTPDHTHASATLAAMELGKHVYCEKPLTHDIWEARVMAEAAAHYGVVTQMGIQGHSGEGIRLITEWIQDGAIGSVSEVDAWCSLMYSPPGHAYWSSPLQERPAQGQPVPEHLDWDLWLGPAPERPYHRTYHPCTWRCWWDFGCGMMGDRGAHTLDAVYSALKLGHPETIEATGIVGGNDEVHPDKAKVVYTFPAREGFPPLTLTWYEGQEPPRPEGLEDGRRFPREGGSIFKGDKGMLWAGAWCGSPRLIPETAMRAYQRPAKTLPRVRGGHMRDWTDAIKQDRKAGADFSYSGPLTEMTLLGNIAKRFPNRKLTWDGPGLRVTNHREANAWVKRPRRRGWELKNPVS